MVKLWRMNSTLLPRLSTEKGCIDFPGFMTLLKRKIMVDMDAELAELFSVFDINTDGVICVDDIAKVHAMSGDDIDKVCCVVHRHHCVIITIIIIGQWGPEYCEPIH